MKSKFSIFNFSASPAGGQFSKGFTLIELLVVMILLVSIGSITISILVSSLRSANKSDSLNKVRQSGNYAIAQMSKEITFADCFEGFEGVTKFTDATPPVCQYSNKFAIQLNEKQYTYSCESGTILFDSKNIFDAGLNVSSCSFTCTGGTPYLPPTINIDFTLQKPISSLAEQNASINFKTSITPRNKWCD